jgi:Xaa-Pro aminopeptidase
MSAATAPAATDERVERLQAAAAAAGLDAVVATSDESIAYLSGFRPLQLERLFAVVVRADAGGAIVVPRLDLGQVESAPERLERVSYEASSDGLPELAGALAGARRIGVEEDHLVFARSSALRDRGFELVPAAAVVMGFRARKDAGEVDRVRAACELVEQALAAMFDELRAGAVERQVNARVESWLRERGASAAHPLILFGEDAANPHGEPGTRELRSGDVVCADLSACVDGYWGDLTRCATVGPASEWARETWRVVRDAQAAAIDACRPGRPARDVDAAQRRLVESRPDLGQCLHGAGHAIGLAVHEPPFLVPRTETPLEPGMIFTIEPAMQLVDEHLGIRLEDMLLVTDSGYENMSAFVPIEIDSIERLMKEPGLSDAMWKGGPAK